MHTKKAFFIVSGVRLTSTFSMRSQATVLHRPSCARQKKIVTLDKVFDVKKSFIKVFLKGCPDIIGRCTNFFQSVH